MFKEYLKNISKVEVYVLHPLKLEGKQILNTAIFDASFDGDPISFKSTYFSQLQKKERKLVLLQEDIQESELSDSEKKLLLREVYSRLQKIHFLKSTYDIEAQKINQEIIIEKEVEYDFYNKIFFEVSHKDLKKKYYIKECEPQNTKFTKKEVLELIEYSNTLLPDIEFRFGDFPNFSHNKGVLNITDKKKYNLQNIISLFFHETTHFFRGYNGLQNLGFRYRFESYQSLEEGIAIYNEYLYGNRITNYGSFNPYYHICYQILLEDISEKQKQEKIYRVLSCKGYNRKKSLHYYYRFHKFSVLGGEKFFLKDLIYLNGYKNVKKILKNDPADYEKIMSGHIGLHELENNKVLSYDKNFDSREYFTKMVAEIKKYLPKKT